MAHHTVTATLHDGSEQVIRTGPMTQDQAIRLAGRTVARNADAAIVTVTAAGQVVATCERYSRLG